ncbi:T9SS type A sorting domain-containing protein, partial [Candidatus Latescibacterota bacterium]
SMFDTDGFPDAVYGFVAGERVYVVLQRLHSFMADVPGLLIAIDPATDMVIDLDPGENGVQGRELLVKNPQFFSQVESVLYIGGHDWGAQTEGVQSVNAGDPALTQTMIVSEAATGVDVTGAVVFDDKWGIIISSSWVQEGEEWCQVGTATWFDPATGELGDVLPVPTPDGGAVMMEGIAYIGSRDNSAPGIYPVDPATNTLVREPLITDLPPTAMVYINDVITEAHETGLEPAAFEISLPYPNPFNPSTTIGFTQTLPGRIRIEVYTATGQRVAVLFDDYNRAGTHTVTWDAQGEPSGVYFIRVSGNGHAATAGVTLVK